MSFIKWLRKNKQKIMVWVVVLIMITFVGGFSLRQLLAGGGQRDVAIATFDGKKISTFDRMRAMNELELLRDMGAAQMLFSQRTLIGPLVALLLFPDSGSASMLDAQLKYAAMQGELVIDDSLVQAFFSANAGDAPMYWILLNEEAMALGCAVSTEDAMDIYRQVALGITRGQGQASTIVANLSRQHKVPQEAIVDTFAKLLSVLAYVDSTTKTDNVTLPEIASQIGYETEKISASYVEFRADSYTAGIEEVDEAMQSEQFERYKGEQAGSISENNPYGFGYKIPDRVRLEYIIIPLDGVETLISAPTDEEMESHYTRNRSNYTEETRQDASNPNSPADTRIKSYSEVRDQIRNELIEQRTNARAELIMNEIRADIGRDLLDKDTENMSGKEIKEYAGDYIAAAQRASEKVGIAIGAGKTGFLSRNNLRSDRNLGRLSEQRPARMPVELITKAFAVQGLDADKLSRFDGVAPKIYENIGPMQGMYPKTLALVRVVDFEKAQIPADIDFTYDATKSSLTAEPQSETFSVREKVVEDCKIILAMQTAAAKAEKFLETARDDWQAAIDAFNETADEKIRNTDMPQRSRISALEVRNARIQARTSSMGSSRLEFTLRNKFLLDKLYELKDAQLPAVVELAPSKSVYAVREVEITEPTTEDYQTAKQETAATIEYMTSLKAAFIQLNVDNLIARTNFEYISDGEAELLE